MDSSAPCSWHSLPNEMKLSIIDILEMEDIKSFSKVDQRAYQACVPAQFKKVKLQSFEALQRFLEDVPRSYCTHIEDLELCTKNSLPQATVVLPRVRADAVIALLSASPKLSKLSFTMVGSMDKSIIAPFPYLSNLKQLSITNCGNERSSPLSERLAVSIALATRSLEILSLDHITRSKKHATELAGVFSFVPLAINDDDIPDHPILGSELSLPSLLRIPTLRKLTIRDTHLGDQRWTSIPVACRLEVLDLGSCVHEAEGFNTQCTERIMAAVGPTIDEFSLAAAVSSPSVFSCPIVTPLSRLRKLHITPFFPLENVVETVSNLAGSPVERISVQCFDDDVVDVCAALEEFLTLRVERGPEFYHKLRQIDVSVTTATDDGLPPTEEEARERVAAAKRLQEFCQDLRLASVVGKFPEKKGMDGVTSFTDAKRLHTKTRSMTL